MPAILRKSLIIAFALILPHLAAAADKAPAADPAPASLPETHPKAPAAATPENKAAEAVAVRQAIRIGSVDLPRIPKETVRGKAVENKLKGMKDKLQARIDAKRKQMDKLRSSLDAKMPTLSQAQREVKIKEFQKKVEEFQRFGKKLEDELLTSQEQETKALYDEIEQAAVAYGKANGFAAIVIKKELLYVGSDIDAQDVTGALITAMNGAAGKH